MSRTYGEIAFHEESDRWILSKLEPHVAIKLKNVFPKVPKASSGPFKFDNSAETCADLEWFLSRYPLAICNEHLTELQRQKTLFLETQAEMERILCPDFVPGIYATKQGQAVRWYQAQAVEVFWRNKALLVGDDLGLGKTYLGIAACLRPQQLPALAVVQTHLAGQWKEKIEAFSNLKVHIIKGTRPYSLPLADIYIMKYTCLAGWVDIFTQGFFRTAIFDEVQEIRRGTASAKGTAAKVLCQNVEYGMGLSVGPSSIVELYGGLFGKGYVGTIENAWEIASSSLPTYYDGLYEIIDLIGTGVLTRGWENGWKWKPIKKLIRHACDKTTHLVRVSGRNLVVTEDHSIYVASKSGINETQTSQIQKGDILLIDNGNEWETVTEEAIDLIPLLKHVPRCQAVVDLQTVTRKDVGLLPWQWQNCHKEATYGTRLPIEVFLSHQDKLPRATALYIGRGNAPCLPAKVILSDWAYMLGFYIGDGWVSNKQRVCFAVESARVSEFCSYLLSLGIGLTPKVRKMAGESSEVRCTHRLLADFLTQLFCGAKCHEKKIPSEWIVSWSRESRMTLLKGLIDSDGHLSKRKRNSAMVYYTTTSKQLTHDILALLRSIGVSGGIHTRKLGVGGVINGRQITGKRKSYSVYWSAHQMSGNLEGNRGNNHNLEWTRGLTKEGVVRENKVIPAPDIVYDIEVDGHPSFSANGVLVHNTATPIYNYADEIWNILNTIKEFCLGTREEFLREWGSDASRDNKVIIQDPAALGTYLREKYLFIRRTKMDVGKYLNPVNRIVETVGYDEHTVKSAEELAVKLARRASQGSFVERGQAARELDLMIRQMTGISKAKYIAEYVRILLENGEPVVLGLWHREVYRIVLEELAEFNPVMYTGTESPTQKEKAKQAFVNGETNLFIISLRSGTGLDGLQERCSTIVIGELDFSPQVHNQLIGRLDREGQLNPVMAIFLVSDSGSDPLIVDLLGLKSSQAQGVIDPHLGVQQIHSDDSRIQMLIQKYLKSKGHSIAPVMPLVMDVPSQKIEQMQLEGI